MNYVITTHILQVKTMTHLLKNLLISLPPLNYPHSKLDRFHWMNHIDCRDTSTTIVQK